MEEPQEEYEPLVAWRAAPDDWTGIAHVNVWAFREFALELGAEEWPQLVRKLTEVGPAAKEGTFFVVRADVEVAGSVLYRRPGRSAAPIPADWASIDLLAVAPPARGSGIGSLLVQTGVALAMEHAAETLGAVVYDYQRDAQELFSRHGFYREHRLAKRGQRPYSLYSKRIY